MITYLHTVCTYRNIAFFLQFTCNLRLLSLFLAKHNMHGLAFLTAQQVPSTTYLSRRDGPTYPKPQHEPNTFQHAPASPAAEHVPAFPAA